MRIANDAVQVNCVGEMTNYQHNIIHLYTIHADLHEICRFIVIVQMCLAFIKPFSRQICGVNSRDKVSVKEIKMWNFLIYTCSIYDKIYDFLLAAIKLENSFKILLNIFFYLSLSL